MIKYKNLLLTSLLSGVIFLCIWSIVARQFVDSSATKVDPNAAQTVADNVRKNPYLSDAAKSAILAANERQGARMRPSSQGRLEARAGK